MMQGAHMIGGFDAPFWRERMPVVRMRLQMQMAGVVALFVVESSRFPCPDSSQYCGLSKSMWIQHGLLKKSY
jgi:hypothetical protein